MPRQIRLYRKKDAARVLALVASGHCVAVVGLSNFGKSTLLRGLTNTDCATTYHKQTERDPLFVYVDCNRMLELTIQGLYEVILRALLESLPTPMSAVREKIEKLYTRIVEPESTFSVSLAFNDALVQIMALTPYDVILMLDEFDEVLGGLEARLFLNMRALKDRYQERLVYIIATIQRAMHIRENEQITEFGELFDANEIFLTPLNPEEAIQLATEIFTEAHSHLDDVESDYILQMAGGHPGLTLAVAQALVDVDSGLPALYQQKNLHMLDQALENHRLVRSELNKLWNQLSDEERESLIMLHSEGITAISLDMRLQLVQRGILQEVAHPRLFARLFKRFLQRQTLTVHAVTSGIYFNDDAGEAWINEQKIANLTDLEYRLLKLMYSRLGKISDKYQIVEEVWGQDYLDTVDDARIEKLVSRLRNKIEPNPTDPKYLLTVRGRGYKLTNGDSNEE